MRKQITAISAEKAVLISLLQNPHTCAHVASRIPTPELFTHPIHQEAYKAILREEEKNGVAVTEYDPYVIAAAIEQRCTSTTPTGETTLDYLLTLLTAIPVADLDGAIMAISESHVRSNVSELSQDLLAAVEDPEQSIKDIIHTSTDKLQALTADLTTDRPAVQGIAEIAATTIQLILEGDKNTYLPTGYTDLDDMLDGGFNPGGMYVIGARPSVGKSAMALDIARHLTIREKKNVLFCNLEMRPQELFVRFLAAEKSIYVSGLTRAMRSDGGADDKLSRTVSAAYSTLLNEVSLSHDPLAEPEEDKGNLWIWSPYGAQNKGGSSVADVAELMEEMRGKVDLLIVDYLQILPPAVSSGNRQQDVADNARRLKEMALKYNMPVLVLSQVNRGSTERADKKPMLSDLRESGAIEQDSDAVFLLHSESRANGGDMSDSLLEVIVAKNRSGGCGVINLACELEYARFANLDVTANNRFTDF
jgi:replicative DNA helicase